MTKADLIEAVLKDCRDVEITKKATTELVDSVFAQVARAVKRDKKFIYPGFGTFTVKSRKARLGRNPQTGEEIKIKASKTVGFKPAPTLKGSL